MPRGSATVVLASGNSVASSIESSIHHPHKKHQKKAFICPSFFCRRHPIFHSLHGRTAHSCLPHIVWSPGNHCKPRLHTWFLAKILEHYDSPVIPFMLFYNLLLPWNAYLWTSSWTFAGRLHLNGPRSPRNSTTVGVLLFIFLGFCPEII